MLQEIIKKYGMFSDSWISSFVYKIENETKIIELNINVADIEDNNSYQLIKLIFSEVIEFVFVEANFSQNFATGDVYVNQKKGEVIFDFMPIDHFDYLEENPNSNFKIKSKKIQYEIL